MDQIINTTMKQITTILLLLISLSGIGQVSPPTSHTIKVKGSGGSGTTDTALIKSLISDSTKRFGIEDNLGLQDRSMDMQGFGLSAQNASNGIDFGSNGISPFNSNTTNSSIAAYPNLSYINTYDNITGNGSGVTSDYRGVGIFGILTGVPLSFITSSNSARQKHIVATPTRTAILTDGTVLKDIVTSVKVNGTEYVANDTGKIDLGTISGGGTAKYSTTEYGMLTDSGTANLYKFRVDSTVMESQARAVNRAFAAKYGLDSMYVTSDGLNAVFAYKSGRRDTLQLTASIWGLAGNALTAGQSYIGSTNNTSMRFRTNGIERMVLDSTGGLTFPGATVGTSVINLSGSSTTVSGGISWGNASSIYRSGTAVLSTQGSFHAGTNLGVVNGGAVINWQNQNNGYITFGSTGLNAVHNISDANPTLTVTQLHASSTGKILTLASTVSATALTVDRSGKIAMDATNTATGTTGAQTINKPSGTVNFAAGASTLVVTNFLALTTSIVQVQVYGTDATATTARVTLASGSFTITLNAAATAETKVSFIVFN